MGTDPRMRSRPRGGGAGTAALLAALAPVPRASARALGRRLEREVLNPSASFSKQ